MKNQVGSTRMDTALKMALIAFISLLAFSSGAYFGKQITDSEYQLKALESDFNKNHPSDVADGDGKNSDDQIAEEEVNALSEKLVNNEKGEVEGQPAHGDTRGVASDEHADDHAAAPAHGAPAPKAAAHGAPAAAAAHGAPAATTAHAAPAAAAKPAAHGDAHAAPAAAAHGDAHADTHADAHAAPAAAAHGAPAKSAANAGKPDLSAARKAAQQVANNAAPVEEAHAPAAKVAVTESRVPTSLPKTVGASQDVEFTVQVASYPTMEAAKDHANELVKKGFPAFPVEASVNGKVWYRVSVGSFRSSRDATTYRAQLLKQTSLPSAIVQKITR